MKAIIKGKRYNTETTEEVAHYKNSQNYRYSYHYREELYRTEKGHWNLAGKNRLFGLPGR